MCEASSVFTWYFTFLWGDAENRYNVQPIVAESYNAARDIMFERYGDHWAFQYSKEQWEEYRDSVYYSNEKELPTIYQGGTEDE